MKKKYLITYTCIDEKNRKFIWDASHVIVAAEHKKAFGKLIQFCASNIWPDPHPEDGTLRVKWGFSPSEHPMRFTDKFCDFPAVDGYFHLKILKPIAATVAKECAANRDLHLLVMVSAYHYADGKDNNGVHNTSCYKDAVSGIDDLVEFTPWCEEEVIASVIEELDCIKILDIKPVAEH